MNIETAMDHVKPTPIGTRWSLIGIWLGLGLIILALLNQRSQQPAILDRYSLRLFVFLLTAAALWACLTFSAVANWRRFAGLALGWAARIAPTIWDDMVMLGGFFIGWSWQYQVFGFQSHPAFRLGLAVLGISILIMRSQFVSDGSIWIKILLATWGLLALRVAHPTALDGEGWAVVGLPVCVALVFSFARALSGLIAGAQPRHSTPPRWLVWSLAGGLITTALAVTYHGALSHIIWNDELHFIKKVAYWSLAETLSQPVFPFWFRPLQSLELKAFYSLMGVNHASYYVVGWGLYLVSALLLFGALARLSGSRSVALLAVLLMSVHAYVREYLTIWPAEIIFVLAIGLGLITLMLLNPADRPGYWICFFGLLLLILISRENGFAVIGGVLALAIFGGATRTLGRRQATLYGVIALAATGVYFVLRRLSLGTWTGELVYADACMGYACYSGLSIAQLSVGHRLQLYAYTIAANALSLVMPSFRGDGRLWLEVVPLALTLWGLVGAATSLRLLTSAPAQLGLRHGLVRGALATLAGLACCSIAAWLPDASRSWIGESEILELATYAALSAGLTVCVVRRPPGAGLAQIVIVFAAGLIAAGSVVGFPYFRYRVLYVPLYGWFLVLAATWPQLAGDRFGQTLRQILVSLMAGLVLLNAILIRQSLPVPWRLPAQFQVTAAALCDVVGTPETLAMEVASHYDIVTQVHDCRH